MGQSKLFFASYDYRDHDAEPIKHYNNIIKADSEDEVRKYLRERYKAMQQEPVSVIVVCEMKVVSYDKGVSEYNLDKFIWKE